MIETINPTAALSFLAFGVVACVWLMNKCGGFE